MQPNLFMNRKHAFLFLSIIGLFTIVYRFLPHLPNFVPVGAMALLSGALLRKPLLASLLVLSVMLLSDVLLNALMYQTTSLGYFLRTESIGVYLGYMITVLFGHGLGSAEAKPFRIAGFSLLSALSFWTISNLFCWPGNPLYAQDLSGLLDCYYKAIPFLGNVAGDLCFSALFFFAWRKVQISLPEGQRA